MEHNIFYKVNVQKQVIIKQMSVLVYAALLQPLKKLFIEVSVHCSGLSIRMYYKNKCEDWCNKNRAL